MRKAAIASLILAYFWVASFLVSPYWTVLRMRSAAAAGDSDRVARYVDFVALRQSVLAQLEHSIAERRQVKRNDASTADRSMRADIVSELVDGMTTPTSVASIMRAGTVPMAVRLPHSKWDVTNAVRNEALLSYRFRGFDVFEATLIDPQSDRPVLNAVFTRDGVFTWKLTAIQLSASGSSDLEAGTP